MLHEHHIGEGKVRYESLGQSSSLPKGKAVMLGGLGMGGENEREWCCAI